MKPFKILSFLLKIGLCYGNDRFPKDEIVAYFENKVNWNPIYKISLQHGVYGIAYDGLEFLLKNNFIPQDEQPDVKLKMQWGGSVMQLEKRMQKHWLVANSLESSLRASEIKTILLKGFSLGVYYPNPLHRFSSDIDIFLLDKYEEGNVVAAKIGAKIEDGGYKHSHIYYKGELIENHKYLTNFNNTQRGRITEKYLRNLIESSPKVTLENSNLLSGSFEFNALFSLKHSYNNFIADDASLRHTLDWMLLLRKELPHINWDKFIEQLKDLHLFEFAQMMTGFCVEHLGLRLAKDNPLITDLSKEKLDAFSNAYFSSKSTEHTVAWYLKAPIIIKRIQRMWNFRYLLDEPFIIKFWNIFSYSSIWKRSAKL